MSSVLKSIVAAVPWLLAMYLLFWIEKNGIWDAETAFRDLKSIAIVATGMLLSLTLQSRFLSHKK